jgi:DNA-binding response OmpR family regulator/two-component sensor histidine kinase
MNGTVLIVDDSLTVRMDLAEAFETAGFHPVLCASVATAREALAGGPVELAVLDVLLPDGDGVALLAELRASTAGVATVVLMLSSEAEVHDRLRGLRTGADEYVGKPYDRSYVVARAAELLQQRRTAAVPVPGPPLVLVIDDSATFRDEMSRALELGGYAVLTAITGEEGLHLAAGSRPEAVIVDGILPGIDGPTVIRRMRLDAALRHTPCLLLTASDDCGAELYALDAGADAFVRKGEDVGVILARLAAVLRTATVGVGSEKTASLLGPKKILAVDDSETFLQELGLALRSEGYDAVLARSGEAALEMLAIQPVDCILLDLLMPGLGGRETCQRIKSAPAVRDIPLIILTAVSEREAMIEGLSTGADDYISKSSDFEVLKARVRAQIRRRQFEDENRRIREELLRKELEASEARAARELAETRAALIGELKRKNEELEKLREQADRENRSKTRFLASMSHELRTPLNAIIGFSEILFDEKAGPLSARQKEFIDTVLVSARHLLGLINQLLDLSKIEAGRETLSREWVSLEAIVASVVDVLASLSIKQGVRLEVDLSPGLPPLYADAVRIKQILYNLLSNGLKFTPAGGTVSLRARLAEDAIRLDVADTGLGIRREDLPLLFREFQQIETHRRREGTGLGLALSKKLVELHGGQISVESEPGRGTTFTVELPLQVQP